MGFWGQDTQGLSERSGALVAGLLLVAEGVPALTEDLGSELLTSVLSALLLREDHEAGERLLGRVRVARLLLLLRLRLLGCLRLLGRLDWRRDALVAEALLVAEQLPGDAELLDSELGLARVGSALRGAEDQVRAQHTWLGGVSLLGLLLRLGALGLCLSSRGGGSSQRSNLGVTLGKRSLEGSNLGGGLGGLGHCGRKESKAGSLGSMDVGGGKSGLLGRRRRQFFHMTASYEKIDNMFSPQHIKQPPHSLKNTSSFFSLPSFPSFPPSCPLTLTLPSSTSCSLV